MIRLSAFADEISQDPVEQVDVLCPARHQVSSSSARFTAPTCSTFPRASMRFIASCLRSRGFGLSAIGSPIGKVLITEPFEPHLERFDIAMQLADFYEAPRIRIFSFYMPPGDDPAIHREAVLSQMAELTRRRPSAGSR